MELRNLMLSAVAMLCCAMLVSSCEDDNVEPRAEEPPLPYEIVISDIVGIPNGVIFNKVKLEVTGFEHSIITKVEAVFVSGQAVLQIPAGYPADKLCKVSRDDAFDYTGYWPTASSNNNALVAGLGEFEVYNNDERVGRVYLTNWDGIGSPTGKSFVYFHFTTEPFVLNGYNYTVDGNRRSYQYAASFVAGWNKYANVRSADANSMTLCTTTIEDESAVFWRFEIN